jgi:heme exporter protein CcmD
MSDFLAMGGYAQYVWPSYILTFIAIAANVLSARRALAQAREDARRRLAVQGEAS